MSREVCVGSFVLITAAFIFCACTSDRTGDRSRRGPDELVAPDQQALLLALAVLDKNEDGSPEPLPARMGILTRQGEEWSYSSVEDPESNVFNNDMSGPEGDYSAVFEFVPPTDSQGRYLLPDAGPLGPSEPVWTYEAADKVSFHGAFISGAQRLLNGHTLVTSGPQGRFFEITPEGDIVWEYWDPHSGNVRMPDGSTPHPVAGFTYAVFRATKIAPDHPALVGRELRPLARISQRLAAARAQGP